uniref:cell division protein FtsQ/DivIB n=1 Tax=Sphingomonas sp. TaxID=28214 RepID=UPI003B3BB0D5
RLLSAVPIPADLLRRARNWTLGLLVALGCVAGLVAMGVPQMVRMETAHALGRMGFVVRNIQISGRKQVDRDQVYRVVMQAQGQDMPLVDLKEIRAQLLQLGWIGEARVSRRLPDTLAIDLVERTPAAILQRNQRLSLIDARGNILASVDPRTMPLQLPLVIGPGVESQIDALNALVATQPTIKPLVEGATWIGERRWDLRFQSGETLSLPEGDAPARAALATFVRKDQQERLLGQGYLRFDMRVPGQIVVRVSDQETAAPTPPPAPPSGGQTT